MSTDDPHITETPSHYAQLSRLYNSLVAHGKFATQAPSDKGGRKSEYIAAVFDAALQPFLENEKPHERILDFGCGTGVFTQRIAAFSQITIGIDVSSGMLQFASNLCHPVDNISLLRTDGLHLPFRDASFDRVVARESLCYVPDAEFDITLHDISRLLKPDGRLLWLEQVSCDPNWQRHSNAPHMVKRAPDSIRAAAQRAGLVIEVERKVRTPRFPWIYPVSLGLIPRRALPALARWEIACHNRFPGGTLRWWNAVFVMRKSS